MQKSDYYNEVKPDKIHLYFTPDILNRLDTSLRFQILGKESQHLVIGQGFFLFENMKGLGQICVGIHAAWTATEDPLAITNLKYITYYLYSGKLPDSILDFINELGGQQEWSTKEVD